MVTQVEVWKNEKSCGNTSWMSHILIIVYNVRGVVYEQKAKNK